MFGTALEKMVLEEQLHEDVWRSFTKNFLVKLHEDVCCIFTKLVLVEQSYMKMYDYVFQKLILHDYVFQKLILSKIDDDAWCSIFTKEKKKKNLP